VFDVTNTLDYVAASATRDVQALAIILDDLRMPAEGYDQAPVVEALEQLYRNAPQLVYDPPSLRAATEKAFATFSNSGEPIVIVNAMLWMALSYESGANAPGQAPEWGPAVTASKPTATAATSPEHQYPAAVREQHNQDAWQRFCREQACREIGYATPGLGIENYEEASDLKKRIVEAFEAAEIAAADAGFDYVFVALIKLLATIIADIDSRVQTAVPLVAYNTLRSINSLTLSWRFYHDAERDIELVDQAGSINPAFMPLSGQVRAS
jgi:hypothetical protein